MSWTIPAAPFWVGETFPIGYTGSGARTHDFFEKPVKATVARRVAGGAHEYGCVPMLKKDCGKRKVTFRDASPGFATVDGSYAIVPMSGTRVSRRSAPAASSPARAVPTRARPVCLRHLGRLRAVPPVPAADQYDLAKRLLDIRVGGSLVLRGTGGPYPTSPESGVPRETGSFTGKLVFKRVK